MADDTGDDLTALRREIDRIDESLHGLLMERGLIIDRLIATKRTGASGSAFRPEREAAMMRVLAARHRGRLPVEAVEGIWRVIISTFTHVQAPFSVHADISPGAAAMQDSARFHFGFTIPYIPHADAHAVVRAVAGSRGDLGLVSPGAAGQAWWRALEPEAGPKIIARLPFTNLAGHPAARPVLVVSKAISSEGLGAVLLHSATGLGDRGAAALAEAGIEVVARHGPDALLATPGAVSSEDVAALLGLATPVPVGSHPALASG